MLVDFNLSSLCLHVKALAEADEIMSQLAVKSRIFTAVTQRQLHIVRLKDAPHARFN